MSGNSLPPALESQILRILDGPDSERDGALEALCDANPEARDAIRRYAVDVSAERDPGHRDGAIDSLPERIGPYRILEILGEGGMGIVYLAEQRTPLERRVALKVIRLGLDTKQVLARFEAERSALSRMEHPCIARVLDAGRTESGQPFFAMEVVRGVPLTDYCDRYRLDTRHRLELFVRICEAVQHAHSKGIVHRDLKPSNILVTDQDGKPVPKIIDFGLARATDQRLTEQTYFTAHGVIVGTPAYMSPEQADGSGLDVDTRTDVYSLGVLLYEMLSGHLPFDPKELQEAGYAELQRKIRDDEPPKPSTRVTTVDDADVAPRRQVGDTATLARQLRGDLDWITMRALEKDRNRRFSTPMAMADDVLRHLRGEPVESAPPALSYRLGKWGKRYRWQVAAASLVLVSLLVGVVVSTSLFVEWRAEAKRSANFAKQAEERERTSNQYLRLFGLLSEVARLRETNSLRVGFLPAWPDKEAALRKWLDEYGVPSEAALPEVRKLLKELRSRAIDSTEIKVPVDWDNSIAAKKMQRVREQTLKTRRLLASLRPGQAEDARKGLLQALQENESVVDAMRKEAETDVKYRFADTSDQQLHDALAILERLLTDFLHPTFGELKFVRDAYAWSSTVWQKSVEDYRERWQEAIASIAKSDDIVASKSYRGLELTPQAGLVPLRMNRSTKLWEFAHLRSGELPRARGRTAWRIAPATGLVFVLLPGASFRMGAQKSDASQANYDPARMRGEEPVQEVTLEPFFISRCEVTQAQWRRLAGSEPSQYIAGLKAGKQITESHPVEMVSWLDCTRVLREHGLDLPTEAQWEYAARAGTSTPWWPGNSREDLHGSMNIADRSAAAIGADWLQLKDWPEFEDGWAVHAPVDALLPNPFGLHHVHGNVREWCRDFYTLDSYRFPVRAGDGLRELKHGNARVARGGMFSSRVAATRSSARDAQPAGLRALDLGLRPIRRIIDHGRGLK